MTNCAIYYNGKCRKTNCTAPHLSSSTGGGCGDDDDGGGGGDLKLTARKPIPIQYDMSQQSSDK